MYTTNTNYRNGSTTEDDVTFTDGLQHAIECCKEKVKKDPEIKSIIIMGGVKDNYLIYRDGEEVFHRALGKFWNTK